MLGKSFVQFRNRYAEVNEMFPSQVRKWLNQDDLNERFHEWAFVCKAEDVLDLPEVTHDRRTCKLTAKTRRVYDDLEEHFVAEIEAGVITAANALVKLLRLQQCTSGFVSWRDDFDETQVEELGTEKETLLLDLLTDIDHPAVVFCRFRRDLDAVERVARKLKRQYGELSGRRKDLTEHAQMPEWCEVFGVQIQAGGVGVDRTRANYGIYFSLGYSLGEFKQSVARLHRPGQDFPVHFYHLVAEGTVDEVVYRALEKREEVVQVILNEIGASHVNGC